MPTVVRQEREIKYRFTTTPVMLRKVFKDVAFDFPDMTVRIHHFSMSHATLLSPSAFASENFLINRREHTGHKKNFLFDRCVLCG
jgi:hypothetical protein